MVPTPTMTSQKPFTGQQHLVVFSLNQRPYALPVESVTQIIEMVTITPLPQVIPAVEGIINVHGTTVPVVNLCRHLNLPENRRQLDTPIILTKTDGQTIGLIVDNVIDVITVTRDQITRPADVLPAELGDTPLLQGILHTQQDTVLILRSDRLLLPDQAETLARILAALAEKETPETAGTQLPTGTTTPQLETRPARAPRQQGQAATRATKAKPTRHSTSEKGTQA